MGRSPNDRSDTGKNNSGTDGGEPSSTSVSLIPNPLMAPQAMLYRAMSKDIQKSYNSE